MRVSAIHSTNFSSMPLALLCQKSVHGSTGSPRTEDNTSRFGHLAVRPELVEGRTAGYDTVVLARVLLNFYYQTVLEGLTPDSHAQSIVRRAVVFRAWKQICCHGPGSETVSSSMRRRNRLLCEVGRKIWVAARRHQEHRLPRHTNRHR